RIVPIWLTLLWLEVSTNRVRGSSPLVHGAGGTTVRYPRRRKRLASSPPAHVPSSTLDPPRSLMSRAFVEWARDNSISVRRAYELLISFGLDPDMVKRNLVPKAVMTARDDFRARVHARQYTARRCGTPWSSSPDKAQTIQLAVLRMLREA